VKRVTDPTAHPLLGDVPAEPEPEPSSFKDRLLDGLRKSIEERGYQETTITDIVRHARASRRTFYVVFSTKDECFVALMQAAHRRLLRRIAGAVDLTEPWDVQARRAVEAYVDQMAAEPGLTRSWVREFPALGAVAHQLQRDSRNDMAVLVQRLSDNDEFRRAGLSPVSREIALVILGGLRELTATVIEDGGDVRDITEVGVTATLALLATGREAGDDPPAADVEVGAGAGTGRRRVPTPARPGGRGRRSGR
jgi:AcrR family transcriptional regulator